MTRTVAGQAWLIMTTVPVLKSTSDNNIAAPFTSIRSAELVVAGKPFLEFPQYSILDLQRTTGVCGGPGSQDNNALTNGEEGNPLDGFSEWFTRRLHIGQPFVIQDFEKLPQWDRRLLSIESLIELSTKKSKALWFLLYSRYIFDCMETLREPPFHHPNEI